MLILMEENEEKDVFSRKIERKGKEKVYKEGKGSISVGR